MKVTNYTVFCLKVFEKLLIKYKKISLEEKHLPLVKADIPMSYEEYYSTAIMNTVFGFIIALIVGIILSVLFPINQPVILFILIPLLVALIVAGFYYLYPGQRQKKRGRNIDLFLPYAINFISSMAVVGISPAEIFETLSNVPVYGEVQIEAKKINKEIRIMGQDNITALKHAIEVSPSKKLKSFLQGIVGTIQSGSDLYSYLSNVANKYMEEDLTDRKKDLDLLEVIAEVMVLTVIAFPILLVIILTVFGFFGGSMSVSLSILLLFSFIILPIIYASFYMLIKSTSIEQITKGKPLTKPTFKEVIKEYKPALLIVGVSAFVVLLLFVIMNIAFLSGWLKLDLYTYWDFVFIAILIIITPIGFYNYRKMKIKNEMHIRLSDFLTEVGDSLSTGMNIFDSIKAAEKGHFGKLSPEVKKMKSQLSWNVSMKNVLFDFANRMKSAIAQRIVIAIDKGLLMGGNTPKIFKAAAKEVDQVNQLEYQRKSTMTIYALVIFVCFFVFLGIVMMLNTTIFASFLELQAKQAITAQSVIKLSTIDQAMLEYTLYTFVFVQSIGAGLLAGFMVDGKVSSGVRYCFLLAVITIVIFKFFM
jgi:flagellar protein FlaJ